MHGYQIIQELSERSGGSWRPSPGSVYPTLQLLEDEGLVTGEESAGKRVYRLTDAGKTKVAETQSGPAPWDDIAEGETRGDLRGAIGRFMAATWQVMQSGDKDQVARATEILNEARKKMYAILSED
jgi:DNA-binding PadR family transcriptional regulator